MKRCRGIKILSLKDICENLREVLQKDIVHIEIVRKVNIHLAIYQSVQSLNQINFVVFILTSFLGNVQVCGLSILIGSQVWKGIIMSEKIYNIGQVLTAQRDIEFEKAFGEKEIVKKGTKVYVGADNFVHYSNGDIQNLDKNAEVKGYSVSGLADFIWMYIQRWTNIDEEVLEIHNETMDSVKEAIIDALEELGMYDHTGNRK